MMVAASLQLILSTILLGIILSSDYTAYAAVSITSNTDGAAICPAQELILTCVAENTVALRWRVYHSSSFIEKAFTRSSSSGARDTEGVFTFTLVSNANYRFESLLMTVATQSLHNTAIECHSASTSLISSFTVKIESTPKSPANLSRTIKFYQSNFSTVEITWNPPLNLDPQVDYYYYELRIDRLNESVVMDGNTSNTSAILEDIPYNNDLIFSLSAVNCVGRSSPATYNINIVGCLGINSSSLQVSPDFSQAPGINLSLSCVHNPNIQVIVTCQDDGQWEPDPYTLGSICDTKGIETTKVMPVANLTNGPIITNDNEDFPRTSYIVDKYSIISASASLFSVITVLSVIGAICIYQVRKRRKQALCRNLERHYETVNEPVYEMVSNYNPNNNRPAIIIDMWSDCDTKCNEAYEKSGAALH